MSKRNKILELLRGLLAERQQFEQWLAALASKREVTPETVYNRVHQDYQSRLDNVLDRLQSHTQDLQASMSELATQLAEATEREATRLEAQQEAELRAAVGEFTADRWSEMSRESESELRKLAQERGVIESQLNELSEILGFTQGRTPPKPVEPPPKPVEPPPKPVEPPPKIEEVRDLGDKSEQVKFPNWSESDKREALANSVATTKSKTAPIRPEAEKTLKCSECGSMNFPTEWYCEKCGAELATL